jgi:hypothetical protein
LTDGRPTATLGGTGVSIMKRIVALAAQPAALLILGCALLFDLPLWIGLAGLALGAGALFIPDRWAN